MLPMSASAISLRLRLRLEDYARTHRASILPTAFRSADSWLRRKPDTADALARYLVASHPSRFRASLVRAALAAARVSAEDLCSRVELNYSVILKAPQSPRERGVLLVSFEPELQKLVRAERFAELEEAYQIAFLPTWQPFYSGAFFRLVHRARRPFFVMPSCSREMELCRQTSPLCEPLPFQSSSWVPKSFGFGSGLARDIDFLMLANFSKYKRHWRFFEAIPSMASDARIVVAGRPLGDRTLESLRREARAFGAEARIRFVENPSNDEVRALLGRARVVVATSHKEGSYIGVAEALMAGASVAMYENAQIGSRECINRQTGFLLSPRLPLGEQLMQCLVLSDSMDPASWAKTEWSAEANVGRWNALMRAGANSRNEPWTVDIAPFFCRNFDFIVVNPDQRSALKEEEARCERDYGVKVK